jgi:hypothetical protein
MPHAPAHRLSPTSHAPPLATPRTETKQVNAVEANVSLVAFQQHALVQELFKAKGALVNGEFGQGCMLCLYMRTRNY